MRSLASTNNGSRWRHSLDVSALAVYCFAAFWGCFFANNAQRLFNLHEEPSTTPLSLFHSSAVVNQNQATLPQQPPAIHEGRRIQEQQQQQQQPASIDSSASPCAEWDLHTRVQKQIQKDFCLRHFAGEPVRSDIKKVKSNGPDDKKLDFFIYNEGCYISQHIVTDGAWEPEMSQELAKAMAKAATYLGLSKENIHFMDIGSNIGTHATYLRASGYPVIAFEPLPINEDLIRSNFCSNDPDQKVTLFTKALGSAPMVCDMYSAVSTAYIPNRGNGIVSCDGTVPKHFDGEVKFRGKMEVMRLDDVMLCEEAGKLPIQIGALKMDAEGFEPNVIEGGLTFFKLAKIPFVVFEIAIMAPEVRSKVLGYFEDMGYKASPRTFFDADRVPPRQVLQMEANVYLSLISDEVLFDHQESKKPAVETVATVA